MWRNCARFSYLTLYSLTPSVADYRATSPEDGGGHGRRAWAWAWAWGVGGLTEREFGPIFNPMVNYQPAVLDRTFAALADPTRRALLARLDEEDSLSVSELAKPFPVSLPAIMKHLDVLSDAGLITRSKTGRTVTCQLTPAPMEQAMEWLARYERYWTEQLDRLAAFLEEDQWQPSPPSSSSADSKPRRKKSTKRGPSRSK